MCLSGAAVIFLVILGTACGDVSVILGGESDGIFEGSLTTVEAYSPRCGLFQANLPPLPKGRKSFGATYLDGSIYVCGGYNLVLEVKECFKLDLTNVAEGWVPIAPLLKGRFTFQLVAAAGLIYAIGGEGPFAQHNDIEIYDPLTDTWVQGVDLTGYRMGFCAVASKSEDKIYLMGGLDTDGEKKRLESLDLDTMKWERLADMEQNRSSLACAHFRDGFVAAGGWGEATGPNVGQLAPVATVEYYDITSGVWSEFTSMQHRRTEFVLGSYDNDLLTAFGGYQGGHLNSVEEFDGESNWDYLIQYLQEPKSDMAMVTVPEGLIQENC